MRLLNWRKILAKLQAKVEAAKKTAVKKATNC